jgi:hypothetical protein
MVKLASQVHRVELDRPGAFDRPRTNERPFRNWLSGVQLIEQSLGLLQIERIEAFGESA